MVYPSFKDMTLNPITLRFKADLLENNFKTFYFKRILIQLRVAIFLILTLFSSICYLSRLSDIPNIYFLSFIIYGIIIFILSFTSLLKNFKNIFISLLILSYSTIIIFFLKEINTENMLLLYSAALFTIVIFNYVFFGINFLYAIFNGLIILILYLLIVPFNNNYLTRIFPLLLLITNLVGIFTNYSMEFINRREFYLSTMDSENQKILDDVTDILEERVKKSTQKLRRKNEELLKEIEERKKIEEKMNQSLKEKDVLLKEIHHRVKNNMQIISSMLLLQSRYSDNEKVKNILLESQNRIESMALVHEKLYQSDNLSSINFKQYVDSLAKNILTMFNRRSTINYNIECEDNLNLTINTAIPLGLLISELMTNSVKHGFKNIERGNINIHLQKSDNNKLILTYSNDGNVFPENIDIHDPELKTYGLRLINILTSQLDGNLNLSRENGTKFTITFSMI